MLSRVMSKEETLRAMSALDGLQKLMSMQVYGSGLWLMECLRLRVTHIDFQRNQISIRA